MDPLSLANEPLGLRQATTVTAMAVGLVFGYAAVSKLADVPSLIAAIRRYTIVPSRLAPWSAGLLIAGESLIAMAHLTGVGFRLVVPGTLVLLSIFFAVTASVLKRGDERPCLCFGAHQDDPVDVSSLVRISMLWIAEGALYLLLIVNDGLTAVAGTGSVAYSVESFLLAALVVTLAGWCLTFPKFQRTWRSVRS